MMYGVKRVARYLLGTDVAGRTLAVRPDDTFIVSYPRSGNTWTRFLIANLLHPGQAVSFANIERLIPDAEAHSSRYMKRMRSPRFIKSHQYFDHRYRRVIYLVRDPRDVVLSYYDFSRKYGQIDDGYPLERYVGDFVHGRLSSADWGTWAENVGSWIAARGHSPDFLLIHYEDLKAHTAQELSRMAQFLGLECDSKTLRHAIECSSAERLRELEKNQGNAWVTTRNKREDIPFIGTAMAGKWQSRLPEVAVEKIELAWADLLNRLGYPLSSTRRKVDSVAEPSRLAARRVPR